MWVLRGSTQVRFRATLPQNIHMKQHDFFCDSSLKTKKLPRSFIEVVQSKTYSMSVCTGRVCDFDVFQIPQSMLLSRRCPKNWPPLYTFKSSTVDSQTMQPFSCCIIEQITLETSRKCINNFVFCSFLSSKDGVRCHATPLLVFSHFLPVCCNWFY